MKLLRGILTVIVVLAALTVSVLFAIQNTASVPLDLLVYTFEPRSLAVWVLAAFVLGGILGLAVSSLILLRTRASLVSSKRQLAKSRVELDKLRDGSTVADPQ